MTSSATSCSSSARPRSTWTCATGASEDLLRILDESATPPDKESLNRMIEQVVDGACLLLTDAELLDGALLMPLRHAQHEIETIVGVTNVDANNGTVSFKAPVNVGD